MNTSNKSSNSWLRNIIIVAVAGGLLTTGLFWIVGQNNRPKNRHQLTYTVSRGDIVVSVNEEGRLESANNTEIKCRVKGGSTILWIIDSGETVKKGQELVRLDQSTIEDDISQKTIALENARATMVKSENDVKDAQISIEEYQQALFPSEVKTADHFQWQIAAGTTVTTCRKRQLTFADTLIIRQVLRLSLNQVFYCRFQRSIRLESLKNQHPKNNARSVNRIAAMRMKFVGCAQIDKFTEQIKGSVGPVKKIV